MSLNCTVTKMTKPQQTYDAYKYLCSYCSWFCKINGFSMIFKHNFKFQWLFHDSIFFPWLWEPGMGSITSARLRLGLLIDDYNCDYNYFVFFKDDYNLWIHDYDLFTITFFILLKTQYVSTETSPAVILCTMHELYACILC